MTIGIIGGAGFIGCNLAEHYLRKGKKVIVFDNLSRKGSALNAAWLKSLGKGKLRLVKADIRFDNSKLDLLASECSVIYHLAAQVAVTTSVIDPREDFEINALGTFNVLEAIRKSRRKPVLVYASTNKVYGKMGAEKLKKGKTRYSYSGSGKGIPESTPLDFYSPYGCSKGCGDQYVRDYSRIYGLKTVVFRQSCIYGERQFGVEDQGWIAWFTIAASLGKKITVYGDGKQVRDILHVQDLIRCYETAVSKIGKTSGKIYNIGGGPANTLSLLELLSILERILKKRIPVKYSGWRPGDQKIFVSDIRLAKKDFGWKPIISTVKGVESLAAWVGRNTAVMKKMKF